MFCTRCGHQFNPDEECCPHLAEPKSHPICDVCFIVEQAEAWRDEEFEED